MHLVYRITIQYALLAVVDLSVSNIMIMNNINPQ